MSAVETNLELDGGLQLKAHLDALTDWVPSIKSLLNNMKQHQIYKGFLAFAFPDNKCNVTGNLSKIEVKAMLSTEHMKWEHIHTNMLAVIHDNQATKKSNLMQSS